MDVLSFNTSPLLEWLFESTLYISLLISLVFIIKAVMRGKLPAWWSYGLWLILVLRMLTPWDISLLNVLSLFNTDSAGDMYNTYLLKPVISVPLGSDTTAAASLGTVLLGIWLAGAACFSISTIFKNLIFWKSVKKISPIKDREALDLFDECRELLGVRKNVQIIETARVKSPALSGYFKPRLLLPTGFLGSVKKDELRCVFYHELGHLKCHHIAVSWVTAVLQIIHWFNPFVWYAFRYMRVDQEASCDAFVLARINRVNPADYANTIVGLLERFAENRQLPSLAGIIENRSQIKRRIKMIMNFKKHTNRMTLISIVILFMVGFVFFTSSSGFSGENNSEDEGNEYKVYKIDELDEPPSYINMVIPKFPYEAMIQGIQGRVVIKIVIDKDGYVNDPVVVKAEPEGYFEEAALDAIAVYRFKPGVKDGKPVACIAFQPMKFSRPAPPQLN